MSLQEKKQPWAVVMQYILNKFKSKLKKPYDRDFLYVILRDFLTNMIEMERIWQNSNDTMVADMIKQYGEEQVINWFQLKNTPEMKILLHKLYKEQRRWMRRNNNHMLNNATLSALIWIRQKAFLIEHIIEPFVLQRSPPFLQQKRKQSTTSPIFVDKQTSTADDVSSTMTVNKETSDDVYPSMPTLDKETAVTYDVSPTMVVDKQNHQEQSKTNSFKRTHATMLCNDDTQEEEEEEDEEDVVLKRVKFLHDEHNNKYMQTYIYTH